MRKCVLLLALCVFVAHAARPDHSQKLHDDTMDRIVKHVNSLPGNTWTAKKSPRFDQTTKQQFKDLLGVIPGGPKLPEREFVEVDAEALPVRFDAREAWPKCAPTIGNVRDQGHCGSCWAFGAVEAFSDRICITHNVNVNMSANDVLACCDSCGMGCDGGYPASAWSYFEKIGNVDDSCDPYFDQTGCHHPGCTPEYPTPKCVKKCVNGHDWTQSKAKVTKSYSVPNNVQQIMQEIMTNGPVEGAFDVYQDFATYSSGVYKHVSGDLMGGHAIKIIGWDVDPKAGPYWIVVNSWNYSWGQKGLFWIAKGTNECGIESQIVAGTVA